MRALQFLILTFLLCVLPSDACAWQTSASTEPTAGAGQGGDTEKLAWKLEKGQKFNVALSKTADVTTKVDARTRKVDAETILELDWEVASSDDAGVVIRQTVKRIRLTSGNQGDVSPLRLDYDSAIKVYRSGLSGKVSKQYQPAIGLVSTFKLSPEGKVSDFANEAGQEKKTEKLPDGSAVKEMLTGKSAALAISKMTDLAWQSELNDSAIVKRPVKSELGDFVRVDQYKFKSNDGQTVVDVETSAEGLDEGNTTAKVGQYKGQGSIVFNDSAGFITQSSTTMTVASQSPYKDLTVESLTEVQTTMTLNETQ